MNKKDKEIKQTLQDKGYSEEFAATVIKKGKPKWYKKAWKWTKDNSGIVIAGAGLTLYTAWCIAVVIAANKEAAAQQAWIDEHISFEGITLDGEPKMLIIARDMKDSIDDVMKDLMKSVGKHVGENVLSQELTADIDSIQDFTL